MNYIYINCVVESKIMISLLRLYIFHIFELLHDRGITLSIPKNTLAYKYIQEVDDWSRSIGLDDNVDTDDDYISSHWMANIFMMK